MALISNNSHYRQWIRDIVGDCYWEQVPGRQLRYIAGVRGLTADNEPLIQRCDLTAPLMVEQFPELSIVNGLYRHPVSTHNVWMYHVWCVTKSGEIVDPTGRQFDVPGAQDSYQTGTYRGADI